MNEPFGSDRIRVVPANEASCSDLRLVFGDKGYPANCQCQRFKTTGWIWRETTREQREAMLHAGAGCDEPDATTTNGLVAYIDGEPAGWVAIEPRIEYPKLQKTRMAWTGRSEDKADAGVWSVTCFRVRNGFQGRGLTYALAKATIEHARSRGATAIEGYPMIVPPFTEITWGELYVGARQVFEDAGFREVSHPSKRRVVMRIDF